MVFTTDNGEIFWNALDYILKIKSGEIIYAANLTDYPNKYHDLVNNCPNWKTVEQVLKFCFWLKRDHFNELIKKLSRDSTGKQLANQFLILENQKLSEMIANNKNLIEN